MNLRTAGKLVVANFGQTSINKTDGMAYFIKTMYTPEK